MSLISFLFRNRFRKEMVLIIVLKLIALILIWEICFGHIKPDNLTPKHVAEHFINNKP